MATEIVKAIQVMNGLDDIKEETALKDFEVRRRTAKRVHNMMDEKNKEKGRRQRTKT